MCIAEVKFCDGKKRHMFTVNNRLRQLGSLDKTKKLFFPPSFDVAS